ncbi:MAG: citryl-CoA lyase, partial [Anaerolineae bacterium]
MSEKSWRTAISQVKPNEIRVRGYELTELVGTKSFGDIVYLLFSGDLPSGKEGQMIEAILVACCEHSLVAPSVAAARYAASGGVPLQAAVASGIIALGDYHGGAIEGCARMMQDALGNEEEDLETAARRLVQEKRAKGERLLGYGHPLHRQDPRVPRLFGLAEEYGLAGRYIRFSQAIEEALRQETGKNIPMNVDGAIAAIMLEMGIDWRLGKGFFLISRAAGLTAHVYEQLTKERPFKEIDYRDIDYQGPPSRPLP